MKKKSERNRDEKNIIKEFSMEGRKRDRENLSDFHTKIVQKIRDEKIVGDKIGSFQFLRRDNAIRKTKLGIS